MVRAVWNGHVIAESDRARRVEGNVYFPPEDVNEEFLLDSPTTSRCWWKGKAHYFTVTVDDDINVDAAWTYPEPWPLARHIKDHVAFWHGVRIER